MKKKIIKVFMVHQWDMADLQSDVLSQLKSDPTYEFIDMSYTKSRPAVKDEFIQEYACGAMMESDIIIVLPDSRNDFVSDETEDYLSTGLFNAKFRKNRGLNPNSVYTIELGTLMFDSCNTKPVLVLGWTKESAEYLVNLLRNPVGIEDRAYDRDRFYALGISEISNSNSITQKVASVLSNN